MFFAVSKDRRACHFDGLSAQPEPRRRERGNLASFESESCVCWRHAASARPEEARRAVSKGGSFFSHARRKRRLRPAMTGRA